jgi:hypothetical protein
MFMMEGDDVLAAINLFSTAMPESPWVTKYIEQYKRRKLVVWGKLLVSIFINQFLKVDYSLFYCNQQGYFLLIFLTRLLKTSPIYILPWHELNAAIVKEAINMSVKIFKCMIWLL